MKPKRNADRKVFQATFPGFGGEFAHLSTAVLEAAKTLVGKRTTLQTALACLRSVAPEGVAVDVRGNFIHLQVVLGEMARMSHPIISYH